jgi:hypothetical protein
MENMLLNNTIRKKSTFFFFFEENTLPLIEYSVADQKTAYWLLRAILYEKGNG